jgi:hypothetical protein
MVYNMFFASVIVSFSMFFSFKTEENRKIHSNKDVAVRMISAENAKIETIYHSLKSNNFQLPNIECFAQALKGFYSLKEKGLIKKEILAVIDFSLSSNAKRLWIIDMETNEIKLHSLVAHGRNTGEEFATNFSNAPESFKSSLGFYSTAEVYNGKHGVSLKLDGLDKGLNSNARQRAVVIHGADYVSESFIKAHNRLGRSQGCPAVPVEIAAEVINLVKGGACLYIYHSSMSYFKKTKLIS